jgi:2-succinyl-6-hydroxy-2,4-cyclohexadiene-1-carboxylate synthase
MPRYDVNGIQLNVEQFGAGPSLLMLHGFTGSIAAWQGTPDRLSERFHVIAIDIIGHGGSSAPDHAERYRIERAVEDLCTVLDRLGIERTAVLGYSMGGRVALHLARAQPDRVSALVLESASPGIADPEARCDRARIDERLATRIQRGGLESFVEYWESIPLFASQRVLPEEVRRRQRELRLRQSPVGLANSLRGMGAGAMEPVTGHLTGYRMPVLYLAGEYDEKYREIGQDMVAEMPDARYQEIPGAGHTIHLEQPEAYVKAVTEFLCIDGP